MLNLKVGDRVVKKTAEPDGSDVWEFYGEVKEITNEHVVCGLDVDNMRLIGKFDKDGVSIFGIGYGWIEPVLQGES